MRKPHENSSGRAGILLAVVLFAGLARTGAAQQVDPAVTAEWAKRIVCGAEYGTDPYCIQWVRSPSISVMGGTTGQQRVVAETVSHLNQQLVDTRLKKLRLLKPDSGEADILVYFVPLAKMPDLARRHSFKYVEGNWGYFWTNWNARHEIQRGVVFLASNKLSGATLKHFALEEITQVLGLPNDAPEFRESIFYSRGADGGYATQLSTRDKQLLQFYYTEVYPGYSWEDVDLTLQRAWPFR